MRKLGPGFVLFLFFVLGSPAARGQTNPPGIDEMDSFVEVAAYVSDQAGGSGALNDPTNPFPTLTSALTAGADELRIQEGTFTEDLTLDASNIFFRTWNGMSGVNETLDVVGMITIKGNVTLVNAARLTLATSGTTLRVTGDIDLSGIFDIVENSLVIEAEESPTTLTVHEAGDLVSSDVAGKRNHAGLLQFIGNEDTAVFIETSTNRLRFDFPAIEVDKGDEGHVTFDASGVAGGLDVLGTPVFSLLDADIGVPGEKGGGGVELLDGLDLLDIEGDFRQVDGEFLMAGLSSSGETRPKLQVGGDFSLENGEFWTDGGDVEIQDDFLQGPNRAQDAGDALFSLGFGSTHTVVGDFHVGPNTDDAEAPNQDDEKRNRYFFRTGDLVLHGDYAHFGTCDFSNDQFFSPNGQGCAGDLYFVGATPQTITFRQDEDVNFGDVIVNGVGGLVVPDGLFPTQSSGSFLELVQGIIRMRDQSSWFIHHTDLEPDLNGQNTSQTGTVRLGSRTSHILGALQREVRRASVEGGIITGGYLFPTGTSAKDRTGTEVDFFRPLIMAFPEEITNQFPVFPQVELQPPEKLQFIPSFSTLTVPDPELGSLVLDIEESLALWRVQSGTTTPLPFVRVEADLSGVNDPSKFRILQRDCDGSNPRMLGTYPVDPNPAGSAIINDIVDGVLNVTQENADLTGCSILSLVTNRAINPIDETSPTSKGQFINNIPGTPIDLYLNESLLVNDLAFLTATPFSPLLAVETTFEITEGSAPDNSSPLWVGSAVISSEQPILGIVNQRADDTWVLSLNEFARLAAQDQDQIDLMLHHGASGLPPVTAQVLDTEGNVKAVLNETSFNTYSGYESIPPGDHTIDVKDNTGKRLVAVFANLFSLSEEVVTFVLTENETSGKRQEPTLVAFKTDGTRLDLEIVTSLEETDTHPAHFTLYKNYPNPFNPQTQIRYTLPVMSTVHLNVFDILGRQVRTLVVAEQTAGTYTVTWDGRSDTGAQVGSGLYLYRLDAGTFSQTRRMLMVK